MIFIPFYVLSVSEVHPDTKRQEPEEVGSDRDVQESGDADAPETLQSGENFGKEVTRSQGTEKDFCSYRRRASSARVSILTFV